MAHGTDIMTHSGLILRPDPARTVIRPFEPNDPAGFDDQSRTRPERIADRVLAMSDPEVHRELDRAIRALDKRHRNIRHIMRARFEDVRHDAGCGEVSEERALLIGAYFAEEYAFESAALFNPSMVLHEDQQGVAEGGVRFALSLRGIGEGHLSSVTFRTGTWDPTNGFHIDKPSPLAITPRIERGDGGDGNGVTIVFEGSEDMSESVLFPVTAAQRQGIEDLRMVRFVEDDGRVRHMGTYTAFSGSSARSEMVEADNFRCFDLNPLTGDASGSKGMALFPRRVNGRYAMLGRQDNENIWLLYSDDILHWEGGEKLFCPKEVWEFVQVGNCGSPIEIDEGWLVLTHGVGSVRTYCIGACLLDKDDPSKLLGRMRLPLVHPSPKERNGYVPNVVYSCGAMVHDRTLLLPYGVADNFATFASVAVDDLLAVMH